ncbi:hypothetical protein [Rhizobium sp. 18065]|uniref:hypothetical protein n=1 Tax=Rhizobium sp. 18065 TaxID=2681411 RepID=UPI00135B495C|nr:hypothetical protein [Rhizobium sp. 18065]
MSKAALALVQYHRWWLSYDLLHISRVTRQANRLSGACVRSIAKNYGVARGIRSSGKDAHGNYDNLAAERIAALINHHSDMGDFTGNLSSKFEICLNIVSELNPPERIEEAVTHNDFVSGVTKLVWFVSPRHWTMFDSYAARAVKTKNSATGHQTVPFSTKQRGIDFYKRLQFAGFETLATDVNHWLSDAPAPFHLLSGERVIDAYLWQHGAKEIRPSAEETAECHLTGLGPLGGDLRVLAHDFGDRFGARLEKFMAAASQFERRS